MRLKPKESDFYIYPKIMKKVVLKHPELLPSQIIELAVHEIYQQLLSEQNRLLMQLAFNPNVTQTDLDAFLKNWDIEAAGANRAAVLAYMMKIHPELQFDIYTGPRLKGLLNFLRFRNLELIGQFSKIVKKLNKQGIIPMIIKGGAMRYLRPDLPRVMEDIDILLPQAEQLDVVKKLAQEMGFDFIDAPHSIDIRMKEFPDKGILDIHQFFGFLPELNKELNKEIFKRATLQRVFNADAYVPTVEDMMFICLNNLTHNLRNTSSVQGLPLAVFDIVWLVGQKHDFNWDIMLQDIVLAHTEAHSYMAIRFINQIVPNIFPESFLTNRILCRDLENFINRDLFYSLYVHDVKYACKGLKFVKSLSNWTDFKVYIKLKGQHFFTKRIIKSHRFIRLFLRIFKRYADTN